MVPRIDFRNKGNNRWMGQSMLLNICCLFSAQFNKLCLSAYEVEQGNLSLGSKCKPKVFFFVSLGFFMSLKHNLHNPLALWMAYVYLNNLNDLPKVALFTLFQLNYFHLNFKRFYCKLFVSSDLDGMCLSFVECFQLISLGDLDQE